MSCVMGPCSGGAQATDFGHGESAIWVAIRIDMPRRSCEPSRLRRHVLPEGTTARHP